MNNEDLEQYADHLRENIIAQAGEIKALREIIQSSLYEIGREIGKLDLKLENIKDILDEDIDETCEDMITNRDIDTPPVEANRIIQPQEVISYEISRIYS
jgi:predicted hydrocarbon binding protein